MKPLTGLAATALLAAGLLVGTTSTGTAAPTMKLYGCALDRFTTYPTNQLRLIVASTDQRLARVYCAQWERGLDTLANPVDLVPGVPHTFASWTVQLCAYSNRRHPEVVEVWSDRRSAKRMLASGICSTRGFTPSEWRALPANTTAIVTK